MGRPTKIEGTPDHPASLGATDVFGQASILGLYDPDRSQVVRRLGEISTWSEFIAAVQPALKDAQRNNEGLRILTQTVTSPTLAAQNSLRSEEHTSELQSHLNLVCRLLLEKKKNTNVTIES